MSEMLKISVPEWICPKGHVSKGHPQAFSVTALSSGVSTGNICPVCYVEWIAANVPAVTRHNPEA